MSVVLLGSTSGSVTLQEPAVAGSTVIDLPATSGTMAVTSGSPSFTNITATGTIKGASTISVGNATPSASGAGITFPATQSASSDVNTLDDYEEGTWTPIVGGVSLTGKGRYTKVGRLVSISFANQTGIPAVSVGSAATCTGAPFPVVGASWDETATASVMWNNESTGYPDELACGRIAPNASISITNKGSEATTTSDPWGMSLLYFTN